jgi:hypothetical protein
MVLRTATRDWWGKLPEKTLWSLLCVALSQLRQGLINSALAALTGCALGFLATAVAAAASGAQAAWMLAAVLVGTMVGLAQLQREARWDLHHAQFLLGANAAFLVSGLTLVWAFSHESLPGVQLALSAGLAAPLLTQRG